MALSAPSTPRTNFATPKRTPCPSSKARAIPKVQFATPKQAKKGLLPANTPECFATVNVETPNPMLKRRGSREKFDQESNLTVAVRIRPMNVRELATVGAVDIIKVRDKELSIRSNPIASSTVGMDHLFQYDHVFWSCDEDNSHYSSQEDVFLAMGEPLLNSAFRGYNACLFAYGQTGSGKSFSMMGKNNFEVVDIDSEDFSGLIPRFCRDLFDRIAKLQSSATVEVSYFEIYNEKIHDLLASPSSSNRTPLKVREHPEWGPYVVDLSVHAVTSYQDLRNWLILGNKNRATAATTMNEKSSRSHSIFSIELCLTGGLEDPDTSRRSKVSLVDLAGSERLGSSHNSEEKIREGVSINKSLLTLGKVISALADQKKNQFVPYRESVLTWLLRESLGGNSLTSMLATITPANTHLDETLATLRYACQARSIVNRARVNENPHDRLIRELKSEVQRLKALKQDYERNSLTASSFTSINDSTDKEELDDLRSKLSLAEDKLLGAEQSWKERFLKSTQSQLKELAESEKRREELESKVRVLRTVDPNLDLSLYKTNFLEELEDVLTEERNVKFDQMRNCDLVENLMDWCCQNGLTCTATSNACFIVDHLKKRKTCVLVKDFKKLKNFENMSDFVGSFTWTDASNCAKKLTKSDVMASLNQIYQGLQSLQPPEGDNNLNLLFAKVNRSVQSFETALLNSLVKNSGSKSVTFNL